MTFEEAKQRARVYAIGRRRNVYVYREHDGNCFVSVKPPAKHIGTFTYPYEQYEEAK